MRVALALLLVLAGAACSRSADDRPVKTASADAGAEGGASGAVNCSQDTDCVLAAARCCDCPTFAMPSDPGMDICAGVTCPSPGPTCAMNIHAACVHESCVLACDVSACAAECADGFVLDEHGCATCACLVVTSRACTAGSDCAEVPADCCGCAEGGSDTAVPSGDVASFGAGLDCPSNPACPGVNTCQTAATPQCVQGACALLPAAPSNACGRPDLPVCGAGMVCALNADPAATTQGLGTCMPGA